MPPLLTHLVAEAARLDSHLPDKTEKKIKLNPHSIGKWDNTKISSTLSRGQARNSQTSARNGQNSARI